MENTPNIPPGDPMVHVEAVMRLEVVLKRARRKAAHAIREAREAQHVPLRALAKRIRVSPGALSKLERGKTFEPKTAMRAAKALRHVA